MYYTQRLCFAKKNDQIKRWFKIKTPLNNSINPIIKGCCGASGKLPRIPGQLKGGEAGVRNCGMFLYRSILYKIVLSAKDNQQKKRLPTATL